MFFNHPPRTSARFAFACTAVILLGCVLRLHPWRQPEASPPAPTARAVPAPSESEAAAELAVPDRVLHTLIDFYDHLDRGRYGELYDTVVESRWQPSPDGTCRYAGLVSKEQFTAELGQEFDLNGAGIIVMSYRMVRAVRLSDVDPLKDARPEVAMLAYLPAGMDWKEVYRVQVEGDLGPACLPTSWTKELYVARFGSDDWRLLLADSADPAARRKSQWFGGTALCPSTSIP